MESLDRQILALLASDGRMSYTDIGRSTGLSTSAAQQRVRRLEQRGIITGYGARLAPAALGMELTAFVAVRPIDVSQPDDVPERLADLREVISCYSVAGEANYLLKVQVGTPRHLEQVLGRIRSAAHVSSVTTVVLSTAFEERPIVVAD